MDDTLYFVPSDLYKEIVESIEWAILSMNFDPLERELRKQEFQEKSEDLLDLLNRLLNPS